MKEYWKAHDAGKGSQQEQPHGEVGGEKLALKIVKIISLVK